MPEALDIATGGEKYLPWAKSLLRKLKELMIQGGIAFGRRNYITPDGVGKIILRTQRNGGEWYDYIRIEACVERQGFLLRHDNLYPQAGSVAYYVDGVVERIPPANGGTQPDPSSTTRRLKGWSAPSDLNGIGATSRAASLFSGIMRKAVGSYHIRGENSPFNHSFDRTHGILRFMTGAESAEPTFKYWVCEITASGVFAAPIAYTGDDCTSWAVGGYFTSDEQTQLDLAVAFGSGHPKVTRLLDASDMAAAYARSPFFPFHGWAFNYSGTEAQIVTAAFEPTPARHYNCSRYKISFSHGREDEVPGGIVAASISTLDDQKPAAFSRAQVWVPTAEIGRWEGTQIADATALSTYTNQDAPIHVHYKGDEAIVIRYTHVNHTSVEFSQSQGWGFYNYRYTASGVKNLGNVVINLTEFEFTGDKEQSTYQTGIVSGFSGGDIDTESDGRTYVISRDTLTQTGEGYYPGNFDPNPIFGGDRSWSAGETGGCFVLYARTRTWLYCLQRRVTTSGSSIGSGCLVIMPYDRESVLAVKSETTAETYTSFYQDAINPGVGAFQEGAFSAMTDVYTPLVDGCSYGGFDTAGLPASEGIAFPTGIGGIGTVGETVPAFNAINSSATLMVGQNTYTESNIDGNGTLATFLRTGSIVLLETADSNVFAMHGNLYETEIGLTPANQSINDAHLTHPEGLTFVGGFSQPEPSNASPYQVAGFVGKV